jgi:single-strand DNA-binding protein
MPPSKHWKAVKRYFSIAENQRYKPKGSSEAVEIPTFFSCSFWLGTAVAQVLRKGATVMLTGRVSARPYKTNTGDWTAALNFHANQIEVQTYAPKAAAEAPKKAAGRNKSNATQKQEEKDDLPF